MEYENFDLETLEYQADNGVETFRIRVADSPVDRQRWGDADSVTLPSNLRTRLRLLELHRSFAPRLTLSEMIALGEDIGRALFPERVRTLLDASRRSLARDQGLRIRLMLDTYALADLPWEYAYIADPDTPLSQRDRRGFIVLDRSISFVRYEVLRRERLAKLDPVEESPLRLIAFLSNPEGTVPLNLDQEEENIKQALGEVTEIKPEFYRNPTVDTLTESLVKKVHIFHFAGHGKFEGQMGEKYGSLEGKGALSFAGENNAEFPLTAETLAISLARRGVRLAVLGACESSKVDQVNAWTGIAPALTWAGIPAVIGMRFTIQDQNAIAFSKIFYRALADGQSVDEAVTAGRLAIFTRSREDDRDWGVPVLYLRAEQGVLFPKSQTAKIDNLPSAQPVPIARPVIPPAGADEKFDKRALREAIVRSLEIEDLRILCADVQAELEKDGKPLLVNLEMVGGEGKRGKVLNLIEYLDNRGFLSYLVKAVREARPGII